MKNLLCKIRSCTICKEYLPFAPKPVLRASSNAKILIIGQAPGIKVQNSGIPWDDASGKTLRSWMDIDTDLFYDESQIAIVPMGFCYPGKGKTGDLPPRKECALEWHSQIFEKLENVKTTLLIGQYAQRYYLGTKNLTNTVAKFQSFLPQYFPLPHPSPRNNIWIKNNSWFSHEVLPELKTVVSKCLKF